MTSLAFHFYLSDRFPCDPQCSCYDWRAEMLWWKCQWKLSTKMVPFQSSCTWRICTSSLLFPGACKLVCKSLWSVSVDPGHWYNYHLPQTPGSNYLPQMVHKNLCLQNFIPRNQPIVLSPFHNLVYAVLLDIRLCTVVTYSEIFCKVKKLTRRQKNGTHKGRLLCRLVWY